MGDDMSKGQAFSVRIFIPSGEPGGLRLIEKSNWTGQGLVFPRALYGEVRQRPELRRAGVYLLWGPAETGRLPKLYVGEGDVVLPRLDQHAKQKDFWTHAAVFTSKDQSLNKAHVQYLEARLVQQANDAKRVELDNGNVPQLPALSEADAADAEAFLLDLLLCLPLMGTPFFEPAQTVQARRRELILKAKGIEARGVDTAEGFVVLAGSQAVKEEAPSFHTYMVYMAELRKTLLAQGVLVPDGQVLRVTQDYVFNSPSTAAGVLLGRSANGRTEWRDAKGRTLKEIQEAELGA